MSATSVSVLVPLSRPSAELPSTIEEIDRYLQATGFDFDVRVLDARDGENAGFRIRRGAVEAKGSVLAIVDPALPYAAAAIGDAVAMIESGSADVVFGTRSHSAHGNPLLRALLAPILPDPRVHFMAMSADAARLLIGQSRSGSRGLELEIAYLASKYGFRVQRLAMDADPSSASFGVSSGVAATVRIRMTDRNHGYRAPRRCPVCFSTEVWNWAQIPGNVIRACSRCKCRYLGRADGVEDVQPVWREPRPAAAPAEVGEETVHACTAREKTSLRRLSVLRRQVPSRARVLEIGVRDGSFGLAAAREYEYVGIDRAQATARMARAKGLEVYCSTLSGFVNTGPAFDVITTDHVFESMPDPHDALARMKDLLKPGGALLLTTFDTEGILYLLSERTRLAHNFRPHRIFYSRSALIELLEDSGFEIVTIAPAFEYRDHRFLRHWIDIRWPWLAALVRGLLRLLPDPLLVSSGSIRVIARRRAGPPFEVRAIPSVEPTHAR